MTLTMTQHTAFFLALGTYYKKNSSSHRPSSLWTLTLAPLPKNIRLLDILFSDNCWHRTTKWSSPLPRVWFIDGLTAVKWPRAAPHLTQSAPGVPRQCGSWCLTGPQQHSAATRE